MESLILCSLVLFIEFRLCQAAGNARAPLVVYSAMHMLALFIPHHPHPAPVSCGCLDNHLELSSVAQRVLDDLIACDQNVLALVVVLLLGKVYPPILDHPSGLAREAHDTAFGVEEQQGFGVGDGDGRVCALAAGGDLLADCADEDLVKDVSTQQCEDRNCTAPMP